MSTLRQCGKPVLLFHLGGTMSEGERFALSMFSKHVGEYFQIRPESGESITVELIEATGRGSSGGGESAPDTGSFSLLFYDPTATDQAYLHQASYAFEHQALGPIEIFVVPIGPDSEGKGMRYEAIFTSTS